MSKINSINKKAKEQLMELMGDVDERFIREYMEAGDTPQKLNLFRRPRRWRFSVALAAAMVMLFGTISFAVVPAIGHLHANLAHEREAILKNFSEIQTAYALPVGDTQECNGVTGTLDSVTLEDHYLLFKYSFDWSGLEEAQDGSFHTWFLPWNFYVEEGDTVICMSDYTRGLHTQIYPGSVEDDFSGAYLYCLDLDGTEGQSLVGRELTLKLLYSADGTGFVHTFTPKSCFTDREWRIGKKYIFDGHEIRLDSLRESALYVSLSVDCSNTIGHAEDEYMFILSDELGNDYTVYPYEDDPRGYYFTKPDTMGTQLTLKIVRRRLASGPSGADGNDSYDVLREIPIELDASRWDSF